jgi:two-component system LytT family sensor kinase
MRLKPPGRYLVANAAIWTVAFLVITARILGTGPAPDPWANAGRRALVFAAAAAFCVLIEKLLSASKPWPARRRLVLAAALSAAGALFYTAANTFVFYVLFPIGPLYSSLADNLTADLLNASILLWAFVAWCAIVLGLEADAEAREKTLRLVEAQALAAESQNRMLRYQVNPHFLFNTLNALSSLVIHKENQKAEQMIQALSSFFRTSLESDPSEQITLARELEAQQQYLSIEAIRFGDRLRYAWSVAEPLETALVPSLILQPLVENAVKHGVARSRRAVTIEITAREADGALTLRVCDDAAGAGGAEAVKLGVGLQNVRRRLELLYGRAASLEVGAAPGGGFAAEVRMPLRRP